jgi:unsaturated rhamnogalacturonyl hydrolase
MPYKCHILLILVTMVATAFAPVRASDGPHYFSRDIADPNDTQYEGRYPVPYQRPTVEEVTEVLERIQKGNTPDRLVVTNQKTGEPITDFATPNAEAGLRLGGYPTGVTLGGMLLAADVTGDSRYHEYVNQRLLAVVEYLPYFRAQAEEFGAAGNTFRNFFEPTSLDACGAWGAAMVKARRAGAGPDLKSIIDLYADYIGKQQMRLGDGTLARPHPWPDSLWLDDLYMSVPFLAQMGKLTGDTRYFDDGVRQVKQFANRLFVPEKNLFAHGWHAAGGDLEPRFHWGRANGWCFMAMAELLDVLPEDHPGRDDVLRIFRFHAKGLVEHQSGSGFWHQLLDRTDSYLETSCTDMFTFGLLRGINRGWLSPENFAPAAQAGWNAVVTRVNERGGVEGVCAGTNYATDALYYYNRPMREDAHGGGPVLLAGSEMIRLLQNPKMKVRYLRGGPHLFTEGP